MHAADPLLFFFDFFNECGDIDNLNTVKMFEVYQVRISGNDIVCICFQGTSDKHVIARILSDAVGTVNPLVA